MKNIRKGNDIHFIWTILNGAGEAYNLEGKDFDLYLEDLLGQHLPVSRLTVTGNVLDFFFLGKDQEIYGKYTLILVENDGHEGMHTVDKVDAVNLVEHTIQEGGEDHCSHLQTETIELTSQTEIGMAGPPGPAAGFGTVDAEADNNVGTPAVEVETSGPDTAKNFHFKFKNIKGQKGDEPVLTAGTDGTIYSDDQVLTEVIKDAKTQAASDHQQAESDHQRATNDHTRAENDHTTASNDHTTAGDDHTQAGNDHTTAAGDHTRAESDHTRAESDHAVVEGYNTRLTNVEGEVSQLGQKLIVFESLASLDDASGTSNSYIKTDGSVSQTPSWTMWQFRVKEAYKKIIAHLYSNPTTGLAIAFYSGTPSASTLISGVNLVNGENDYSASIPNNCTYIQICSRTDDGDNSSCYFLSGNTSIKDTEDYIKGYIKSAFILADSDLVKIANISNAYINPNGDASPTNSWTMYLFPTRFIKKIKFKTYSSLNASYPYYAIAFYRESVVSSANLISGKQFTVNYHSGDYEILDVPENSKYVAIACRNADGVATFIGSFDIGELSNNYGNEVEGLNERERNEKYDSVGNPEFWTGITGSFSDMTWVGDKLIGVLSSSDDLTTEAGTLSISIFENGIKEGRTNVFLLKHFWGHCNTIDYNKWNDCLILGNGSGDYNLAGKIIIIPNFSSIVDVSASSNTPMTLSDVNALVIDCASYSLGSKFNLVWGDDNDKEYNIAYLITATMGGEGAYGGDLEHIRKIVLRKGEDVGAYGSVVSNDTPFNGTFDIVEEYSQITDGYDNCDQGTCYYNGELLACIGHNGLWYWRMRLGNGKVYRKNYKQVAYHSNMGATYGNASGICIKDGYLFIGRASIGVMAININP